MTPRHTSERLAYNEWLRSGSPPARSRKGPRPRPFAPRFWALVDKSGPVPEGRPELGPCWIWRGVKNREGYGRFRLFDNVRIMAHRFAFEVQVGPMPDGLEPDHLCRVRACVNPSHIEPVTQAENIRRRSQAKTHCVRGHEFTPQNTYHQPSSPDHWRSCLTCIRERDARRGAA